MSQKNKHTPGPWLIGKHGSVISDPGDNNEGNDEVIEFYGGNVVCESIQSIDDARLIAAAPEMLEALENLADDLDKHGGPQWRGSPMEIAARAAIAKAKGES